MALGQMAHTAINREIAAMDREGIARARETAILAANPGAVVPPWREAWRQSARNWGRVRRMAGVAGTAVVR